MQFGFVSAVPGHHSVRHYLIEPSTLRRPRRLAGTLAHPSRCPVAFEILGDMLVFGGAVGDAWQEWHQFLHREKDEE